MFRRFSAYFEDCLKWRSTEQEPTAYERFLGLCSWQAARGRAGRRECRFDECLRGETPDAIDDIGGAFSE